MARLSERKDKNMGTFSQIIGEADLMAYFNKRIVEWIRSSQYKDGVVKAIEYFDKIFPEVVADLKGVDFKWKNVSATPSTADDWCGPRLLLGGMLPVLVLHAGGDHEVPVYFIVYWNGKRLCGYIPECGNLFNHDTFKAYGNEKPPLSEDVLDSFEYDFTKMRKEVEANITFATDKPVSKVPEKKMKADVVRTSKPRLSDAIDLLIHGIAAREKCTDQEALQGLLVDVRFTAFRLGLNFDNAVAESGKNE
jgi:hypothetical protein